MENAVAFVVVARVVVVRAIAVAIGFKATECRVELVDFVAWCALAVVVATTVEWHDAALAISIGKT